MGVIATETWVMKKIVLYFVILMVTFSCEGIKTYDEAKSLADKMQSDPTNKEHQSEILVPHLASKYSTVLQTCFSEVQQPDDSLFNMVLVIEKAGTVEKIYRDRETNIGLCMFKELEHEKFPEPIVSPYYLHIKMSFTE